jgi:hypothetical protein
MTLDDWVRSGEYLPPEMRDFHDCKDLFKAIHESIDVEGNSYAKAVDWVTGQCYVVDIFLWFMAKHGYTLQRSRKRVEFKDLAATVEGRKKARQDSFFAALNERMKAGPDQPAAGA